MESELETCETNVIKWKFSFNISVLVYEINILNFQWPNQLYYSIYQSGDQIELERGCVYQNVGY
jgi:hypothetical protein